MASADEFGDDGDTTDASTPNAKRDFTAGTSKVEVSAGPAKVTVTNEPRPTRNNSRSKDGSPADKWRTNIKDVPYLKLRPAKAVQMLMYDDKIVIGACHHLIQNGLELTVDNIMNVIQDKSKDKEAIAEKYMQTFAQQFAAEQQSHSSTMNRTHADMPRQHHKLTSGNKAAGDTSDSVSMETQVTGRKLEAENQKLKQARQCSKCRDKVADIILLPCRHISVCHFCWNPQIKFPCPKCNTGVAGTFHVFWA